MHKIIVVMTCSCKSADMRSYERKNWLRKHDLVCHLILSVIKLHPQKSADFINGTTSTEQ